MSAPPPHFPWPRRLRVLFFGLLLCSGAALLVGFADLPAVWVPVATLFLGISLIVLASGVAIVNRGRDGDRQRFLLPSRAGTIETRSQLLAVLYLVAFGGIGLFVTGVSLGLLLGHVTTGAVTGVSA